MNSLLRPNRLTLALISVLGLPGAALAAPLAGGAPMVPPGFEALLEGQLEQVEVVLYGRSLGAHAATVSLDSVRFEEPDVLAAAILEAAPAADLPVLKDAMVEALAVKLPRNGNLACGGIVAEGCGHVDTDRAAIIYDESRGAVQLFLARDWVARLDVPTQRFEQVNREAVNALVHRQYINFSLGDEYRNVAVQGTGALGIGRSGFAAAQWSYARAANREESQSAFRFDNLYYRQDLGQMHYAQAGRMDQRDLSSPLGGNFGFSMLPLPRFDGVRFGSTQAYYRLDDSGNATPVTLLLSRDARVDVLRGNELLGSQYFSAGVQTVHSESFPNGSYPLTLRIYENGVLAREETTPFSKTGSVLGNGELQWFVQGGQVVMDDWSRGPGDDWNRRSAVQAGARRGVGANVYLTAGAAALGGKLYGETKLEWQHAFTAGVLSATLSYLASNDGSRGDSQLISFNNGISWNLYRYSMRGQVCGEANAFPGDVGCYDSINASVSFMLGKWSVLAGYNYNSARSRPLFEQPVLNPFAPPVPMLPGSSRLRPSVTRALQLGLSRSFTVRGANIGARLGAYRNQNEGNLSLRDTGVYAGITISHASQPPTPDGRSSFTSAQADVRTSRDNETEMSYSASYRRIWQNGSYRELGAGFSGYRDDGYSGSVSGRVDSRYGDLDATLYSAYRRGGDGQNTNLAGNYASAFAIGASGFYWGADSGGGTPAGAIAVKVADNDDALEELAAQVSADAVQPFKLGFGQSALVPMEGYRRSFAEVSDAVSNHASASVSVAAGGGAANYFLSPGKLVLKQVQSQATFTYVGRALDTQGNALGGAVVLNALVPNLDEQGGFVLDAPVKLDTLYLLHEGRVFACALQVTSRRDVVQLVGQLHCSSVTASALPAQIRSLPRVVRLLDVPGQTAGVSGMHGPLK
ncbi:hypothetical protein ABH900_001622 [Stenotrophomonas sp. AN71]|uniref:TcfC E-set like domain-containing protein n=1 Tax=Stenotrophomonas sp. AN71 TaxID=3156253 RepID=UPI003D1C5989